MVVFVGTASVEINIERVKARVKKGGHDVPEEDQRRRYPRTLANMKRLLPEADLAVILDNSTELGHILVAFGHKGYMHWVEPVPAWARSLRTEEDFERFRGLTVNERLFAAGLLEEWDAAIRSSDRTRVIELLTKIDLADQATQIVDSLLG